MKLNIRLKVREILVLSAVVSFQKCSGNLASGNLPSGKLDFGDSSTESPVIIHKEKRPSTIKHTTIISDNVPVSSENSQLISCTGTGCNLTHNGNDTVETIVVLQVKTKINSDQKKEFDVNDVPVSIGFNSPGLDQTIEDRYRPNDFRRRSDFDIYDKRYDAPLPPITYGHETHFRPSDIVRPPYSYTDRPNFDSIHFRSEYDPYNQQHVLPHDISTTRPVYNRPPDILPLRPEFRNGPHEILPPSRSLIQNRPNYPPINQPYGGSPHYRENGHQPGNRYNNNNVNNPYNLLRNAMNTLLNPYQGNSDSEININVKSLSPLAVTVTDKHGANNFRENGVELRIPHFEHSANKHYFGDESPPHSVISTKSSNYNPVAFKPEQQSKSFSSFFDSFKQSNFVPNNQNAYNIRNDNTRYHRHIGYVRGNMDFPIVIPEHILMIN